MLSLRESEGDILEAIIYKTPSLYFRIPMEGVGEYKAKKGLIRATVVLDDSGSIIRSARITGDFFLYPEEALWRIEESLPNTKISDLETKIRKLFAELNIILVGSSVEDFLEAFRRAVENARKGEEA